MPLRENIALWYARATAADRRNAALDVALGFVLRIGMTTGLLLVANALLQLAGTPRETMPAFAIVIALAGLAPGPIVIVRTRRFVETLPRLMDRPPRSPAARQVGRIFGRLFFPVLYLVLPVPWLVIWGMALGVSLVSIPVNFRLATAVRAILRTDRESV